MGKFSDLKIALIVDNLTENFFKYQCKTISITPLNYKFIIKFWNPDILFVESCWEGKRDSWKYKIANYPDNPKVNNNKLKKVVNYAKDLNIPTVFWNKEDGFHFERFIDSAMLFDHIFTVDLNKLESYKSLCRETKTFDVLNFAVNPKIHFPQNKERLNRICFLGSYYKNQHKERSKFQEFAFDNLASYGLDIYDRNYKRKSKNLKFPEKYQKYVLKGVNHIETANIYNGYLACLNVNTVTDSPTMFSRRIVEAMACKSLVLTNKSLATENYFRDCVVYINEDTDFKKIFYNQNLLKEKTDLAYEIVEKNFTLDSWLEKLLSKIQNYI